MHFQANSKTSKCQKTTACEIGQEGLHADQGLAGQAAVARRLLALWHCVKLIYAKFKRRATVPNSEGHSAGQNGSADCIGRAGIGDKYFVNWPAFCLASNAILNEQLPQTKAASGGRRHVG